MENPFENPVRAVNLSREAVKFVEKLNRPEKERIKSAIRKIAEDPLLGKKLKGEFMRAEVRSFRVWPYLILYVIQGQSIEVATIVHRKEAYR